MCASMEGDWFRLDGHCFSDLYFEEMAFALSIEQKVEREPHRLGEKALKLNVWHVAGIETQDKHLSTCFILKMGMEDSMGC